MGLNRGNGRNLSDDSVVNLNKALYILPHRYILRIIRIFSASLIIINYVLEIFLALQHVFVRH